MSKSTKLTGGDTMRLEEFIDCCTVGAFVDNDGTGYYASKDKMSIMDVIRPSDVLRGNIKKGYTHVVWFNK